jgi:hypothetical protein
MLSFLWPTILKIITVNIIEATHDLPWKQFPYIYEAETTDSSEESDQNRVPPAPLKLKWKQRIRKRDEENLQFSRFTH